jgi:hypothetical protein
MQTAPSDAGLLRRLLGAVVVVGALGLLAELLLLEHWDDPWQWAPLALLALAAPLALAATLSPGPRVLAALRALMGLHLLAGVVGVLLHYQGNAEFEREREPSLGGARLVWESLRGATPALAPGAMAQLGLLGLLYAFRHPARRPAAPTVTRTETDR